MSELGNQPEQSINGNMPAIIACGGVILTSHDLAASLDSAALRKTDLFAIDNPFEAPAENIARLRMFAEPSRTEHGDRGLSFTGLIKMYEPIDHEHVDMLVSEDEDHTFLNSPRTDRSIHAERVVDGQYIRLAHAIGVSAIAQYDRDSKVIRLTNRKQLQEKRGLTGPTAIEGQYAVEPRAQLAAFADMYFDLVSYVAHIAQTNPAAHILSRRIELLPPPESKAKHIGEEVSSETERPWPLLVDVGGLDKVRSQLEHIVSSFKYPEIMEKWGARRPTGILLQGPPGTGKTMLSKAIGNEIDAEVLAVQSTDIYDKWLGNSEANMKAIFDRAKDTAGPVVVVFDEFDHIVHSKKGGSTSTDAVSGVFKQEMTSLAENNANVLVIGASNNVGTIDQALIRAGRFDYVIEIGLPSEVDLIDILGSTMEHQAGKGGKHGFSPYGELDYVGLAAQLNGLSGADVAEIVRRALFTKAMTEAKTGQADPISQSYFEHIIQAYRKERSESQPGQSLKP